MLRHLVITTLLVGLVTTSCARRDPSSAAGEEVNGNPDSSLVYAAGWKELSMITWGSDVTVDGSTGHFVVGRNGCFQKDFGGLKLGDWNDLAGSINQAIADGFLEKETCIPYTRSGRWDLDGNVDLKVASDKKVPFIRAGWNEVCTVIKNPEVAKRVTTALNHFLIQAAHEGCPNAGN